MQCTWQGVQRIVPRKRKTKKDIAWRMEMRSQVLDAVGVEELTIYP